MKLRFNQEDERIEMYNEITGVVKYSYDVQSQIIYAKYNTLYIN